MNKIYISIISIFFVSMMGCASPVTVKNSQVILKTGEKISRLKFVFFNPELKSSGSSNLISQKHHFVHPERLKTFGPEIESQAMLSFAKYGVGVPETEAVHASPDETVAAFLKGKNIQTLPLLVLFPTETSDITSNMGGSGSYFFTALLVSNSKKILWVANLNIRTGGGFSTKIHAPFLMDEIAKRLGDDGFY